jgi:NTE family protein
MTLAFFRKGEGDSVSGGDKRPRPKIGVALGGGVARGWAHIGALYELAEMGVTPDVVVGASIGAVVGGCYAAGRLEALEEFARSLTKRSVFSFIDVSFNGGGLIGGDRLRARLEAAMGTLRIETLPTRFVCVATEIGAGHEIWLKSGPMVEALRASYALPGVFEPVRIGERWLFDGAIVNPVPVNVARAFGAERVIALSIGGDGSGYGTAIHETVEANDAPPSNPSRQPPKGVMDGLRRRALGIRRAWASDESQAPGLAAVMVNTFNITQDRIMRSRLAGDPPDVLVTLKVGKIGLFEFHRADELIALGRAAVRKARDEILEHLEPAPAKSRA